jgi:hypothetical protein
LPVGIISTAAEENGRCIQDSNSFLKIYGYHVIPGSMVNIYVFFPQKLAPCIHLNGNWEPLVSLLNRTVRIWHTQKNCLELK